MEKRMANMGKYCKAYIVSSLRQYKSWSEATENIRPEKKEIEGKLTEVKRDLTENDYLFLQENYTVTDGIFLDENIIFDQVTPEWVDYCKNTLQFEVPDFDAIDEKMADSYAQTINSISVS
jgi:hypothetical protein